jgi:uncharacterized protein YhbP (UPF0306 family)
MTDAAENKNQSKGKGQGEKEKILESIRKILQENTLLSLATNNKSSSSSICSVYYAYDKSLNFYFWSEKGSRHSKNIGKGAKVAASVLDTSQAWGGNLKGLKIYGKARELKASESGTGAAAYLEKFPKSKEIVKSPEDFSKFGSRLYCIIPEKIVVLDEETFGKDEYKEVAF